MAQRTHERFDGEPQTQPPSVSAREAIRLARECIGEITEQEAAQMVSVAPTSEGGWLVEVEVIEERRIPSSADILGLYEIELDADGELLAYRRTQRYPRVHTGRGGANGGGPA